MFRFTAAAVLAVSVLLSGVGAAPDVSFSGYLDTDVWTDFTGRFYTNAELDLGIHLQFTDAVSANLYVTAISEERIPAGVGNPADRWPAFDYDGFDITYASPYGEFSVGDLVYGFGDFNYYLYKRLSMIAPESFSRGLSYEYSGENFSQYLLVGVSDEDYSTVDIVGKSSTSLGEDGSLGLVYGINGNARSNFSTGFDFFAGAEYRGSFGALDLKLDLGLLSLRGEERSSVVTLLVEPEMAFGDFFTALTFYRLFDFDSVNDLADPLFGIDDEMFVYVEPGYAFNETVAFGLPLEYHSFSLDTTDDDEFWVVPTLYIYPADMVEWWIWGQVAKPTSGDDAYFGFGMEVIVNF